MPGLFIYRDNSSIFIGAQAAAVEREGEAARSRVGAPAKAGTPAWLGDNAPASDVAAPQTDPRSANRCEKRGLASRIRAGQRVSASRFAKHGSAWTP